MPDSRRICIVTGSRAEYGLTRWLMRELVGASGVELQVLVTGTHLDPAFGETVAEIEADGMPIAARVPLPSGRGAPIDTVNAVAAGTRDIGAALDRLEPDIVVVFGDRFEMLAATQAAMFLNVPIAHIGGGDNTRGTHDDYIRHCITKMAQVHFVSHDAARRRVIQLGEEPPRVYDAGALAVDATLGTRILTSDATTAATGIDVRSPFLLVSYHPVTLNQESTRREVAAVTEYLRRAHADGLGIVMSGTNADAGHGLIRRAQDDLRTALGDRIWFFESLGSERYLNVLRRAVALLGNSSSGLYEAPLVGTPTVNIGDRQRGRAAGESVIHVSADADEIEQAVRTAFSGSISFKGYPYGDGPAAPRIAQVLRETDLASLGEKEFFDLSGEAITAVRRPDRGEAPHGDQA